jgi:hypothetical protein
VTLALLTNKERVHVIGFFKENILDRTDRVIYFEKVLASYCNSTGKIKDALSGP